MKEKVKIAILASGKGSNADRICRHFKHHTEIIVGLIISNKPTAGVLNVADEYAVPKMVIENDKLHDVLLEALKSAAIDFIVLAGFLRKIPSDVVSNYHHRMVNIHPALLPKFGGKGMYGEYVHKAVLTAGEAESGITVHWVSETYDEGDILFQRSITINKTESPSTLAEKIHQLEHRYYPEVIEKLITQIYS